MAASLSGKFVHKANGRCKAAYSFVQSVCRQCFGKLGFHILPTGGVTVGNRNMVRKLKYHEKKLLKKVDFISWEVDNNLHEIKVMRKYYIQKREDYTKYVT